MERLHPPELAKNKDIAEPTPIEPTSPEMKRKRKEFVDKLMDPLQRTAEHSIGTAKIQLETQKRNVRVDSLTGLPNRTALQEGIKTALRKLAKHLPIERRTEQGSVGPFYLVYMDANDFKPINDKYGHAAGDEALRATGKYIRKVSREGIDVGARLHGDEFAILYDGYSEEKIRNRFTDPVTGTMTPTIKCEYKGQQLEFTLSVGMRELTAEDKAEEILHQADLQMQAMKRKYKELET